MVYPTNPSQETRRASRAAQRYALLHFPEVLQIRRWVAAGLFLLIAAITIQVINPLDLIITWQLTLTPGTMAYHIWQNLPDSLMFRAFVFNITNPEAFLRGEEKLNVEEMGPFVFREVTVFENLTLYDNNTAYFHSRRHLEFLPEQSIGHPENFTINTINIPLLGAADMLGESALVTNLALRSLTAFLGSKPFLNITAHQLFWGYDDPLISMAHTIAPFFIDFRRLGLLDRLYDKEDDVTIYTGRNSGVDTTTDIVKKAAYSIETYNGVGGFDFWGFGRKRHDLVTGADLPSSELMCDTVEHSFEGYLFPRNIAPGQRIYVYRKQFCRTVPLDQTDAGISAEGYPFLKYYAYRPALINTSDTEHTCYCTSTSGISGGCLPPGFSPAFPCYYQLPIVLSLPHMLGGDDVFAGKITGMVPDFDSHMSYMRLQTDLGIPLEIKCRLQVNLLVRKTRQALAKPFHNMAIPVMWIEMDLTDLPDHVKYLMWLALSVGPKCQATAVALLAVAGVAMLAHAFVLRRRAVSVQRKSSTIPARKFSALQ